MSKKDQELLLIDLSARLLYGVKCHFKYGTAEDDIVLKCIDGGVARFNYGYFGEFHVIIDPKYIKPYLRPMSSMTEEEREYYDGIRRYLVRDDWEVVDWLNANHFDYRGLIPMGLALEAREGMYNIKTTCDNCKDKNYCSQSEYVKINCCKLK